MVVILPVAAVVILLVLMFGAMFNGLIRKRNATRGAWAQIDVQLKRRADLVPNLVATVKGYAAHEQSVFAEVTQARAAAVGAQGPADRTQAEGALTGALRSLFAVAEAYPDLKASGGFIQLQQELDDAENRIAYSRQAYNDSVEILNDAVQAFPRNLVAGMFGITSAEFFNAEGTARGPVQVQF